MKSKIIVFFLLIISLITFIRTFSNIKSYILVKSGNRAFLEENYKESYKKYQESYKLKEENKILNNILKTFYMEKEYEKVVTSPANENFLKGNAYVYSVENKSENDKKIESYNKALELYKLSFKTSEDINIKKNYEIILKRIEELQKQQNQNNQQEENKKNNQKQNTQQNSNQDSKNEQEKNQSQKNQEEDKKENIKQDEIKTILKKLENSEKQSFKNNEKYINISDENSTNRW